MAAAGFTVLASQISKEREREREREKRGVYG
jgi:hypothetical protein